MTASANKQIEQAINGGSTKDKSPKSMRLNKGHREDIIKSVMKAWDKKNKLNSGNAEADFLHAVFKKYKTFNKSTPHEYRNLAKVLTACKELSEARKGYSEFTKPLAAVTVTDTVQIFTIDSDGVKQSVLTSSIPRALATELGLPTYSFSTSEVSRRWADRYGESEGSDKLQRMMFPLKYSHGNVPICIPRDGKEFKAYSKTLKEERAHDKERTTVKAEVTDYLDQFNTTGQLREHWPEIVDHLPAHLADPERVINLPALTKSRLNERLGL